MRLIIISIILTIINDVDNRYVVERLATNSLSPVIFVPGDGGSQMEAKLNKPTTVHYICDKTTKDWFNIWLNLELLAPIIIDCWIDNVRLHYDPVTRTTHNSPGVEIRIPVFGDPEIVEWLDPSHAKQGAYFSEISNALVRNGYVRNLSIRGAPYDFRKAPNENAQWFIDMKNLVEETYNMNGNISITIIAHSMGAPMTLIFLRSQTEEWKEKYIARIITIAGAYAGSAKPVKVFAMGDDLGAFALRASVMRDVQISMASLSFLLPYPSLWKPDEVLVRTKTRTYSYSQLEEFFNDLNYPTGWNMRQDNLKYIEDFSPPNVEIHSLFGSKIKTVEVLDYKKTDDLSGTPDLIYGDGDGTVNSRSLRACAYWRGIQKQPITTVEIPNAEHFQILSNAQVVEYILDILVD